jgi:signal transduction histidine kinase
VRTSFLGKIFYLLFIVRLNSRQSPLLADEGKRGGYKFKSAIMKVLIADDSKSMRQMLQGTLEEVGYDVVVTENGQQAWEALREGYIRLAILDWMMPGMDGLEVCRKLQKENILGMIHVILLTSLEGTENVVTALQSGASDYICKPFHPDELLARLKAGERIVNMQMQLSHIQKMDAIGHLAAGIAHEINTPLQYIKDNTIFVQDAFRDVTKFITRNSHNQISSPVYRASQGGDERGIKECDAVEEDDANVKYLIEEVPRAIKESLEGLEHITKIVGAMKEFTSPGAQKKKAIDINKAIENTITVSKNEWKNKAEMKTNYDANLPLVPCFPTDFKLMVLHIIINAAQAIADSLDNKKESRGTISISTRRDGDWVEIRIGDTGTGIPEEIRSKIFDPFFTTKEVGRGTGLGLSISHSIVVEKHGGTITFDTETGKGTTFIIRLPIGSDMDRDTI